MYMCITQITPDHPSVVRSYVPCIRRISQFVISILKSCALVFGANEQLPIHSVKTGRDLLPQIIILIFYICIT